MLIYLNDKLFFGGQPLIVTKSELIDQLPAFRTGPDVSCGNLCSCMGTAMMLDMNYAACFCWRDSSPEEIRWNVQSRTPLEADKNYDLLGVSVSLMPTYNPFLT